MALGLVARTLLIFITIITSPYYDNKFLSDLKFPRNLTFAKLEILIKLIQISNNYDNIHLIKFYKIFIFLKSR